MTSDSAGLCMTLVRPAVMHLFLCYIYMASLFMCVCLCAALRSLQQMTLV